MEFWGCIDGQQAHWYELRMKVEGDGAQIRRSGIVRNIDQAKLVEEQAHEANRRVDQLEQIVKNITEGGGSE